MFMYVSLDTPMVKLEHTTERLVTILKENKFVSGAHIDVYDELPQ